MLRLQRQMLFSYPKRTFKNFGHKREAPALVTVLWHGALTFGFIGLGIEWKRVKKFMFGDTDLDNLDVPVDN